MDELGTKVLHYAIDWSGEDTPVPMGCLIKGGLRYEWLHSFNPQSGRFSATVLSALVQIAASFLQQNGSLPDKSTLGRLFGEGSLRSLAHSQGREGAALIAEAQTILACAGPMVGNGGDVEDLLQKLSLRYKRNEVEALLLHQAKELAHGDPNEIARQLSEGAQGIRNSDAKASESIMVARDVMGARWDAYEASIGKSKHSFAGVPSGFYEFDKRSGGLAPGQVVVVAGGTGLGKTLLRERILLNVWQQGHSVAEVLAEFNADTSQFRLEAMQLCETAGRNGNGLTVKEAFERGLLNEEQIEAYLAVLQKYATNPADYLWVQPGMYETLDDLEPIIARMKEKHNVTCVGIDDLHNQLLRSTHNEDHLHQGDLIVWCKKQALLHGIVLVVECQEDPATEKTRLVVPGQIVKYSRKLSQKADVILRLYAPNGRDSVQYEVQVLKNRGQEDGYFFTVLMDKKEMRIRDDTQDHVRAQAALKESDL